MNYYKQVITNNKMYNLLELCTGTGGFSVGFHQTNKVKTVYANDIEESSKTIYKDNFPATMFQCGDINTIDLNALPACDILTSGFSCQGFSIAGKQLGFEDERSSVFFRTIELMKLKQPKIAILENVKNILTHDKCKTLERILKTISDIGYTPHYELLNTSTHTPIPQNRERIFFICVRNDLTNFEVFYPKDSPYSVEVNEMILHDIPEKYYYSDRFKVWTVVERDVVKNISTNAVYQYRRTVVRENKTQRFPTLTANAGKGGHNTLLLKDDVGIRKMTPREYFGIQGFPDTYKLHVSLSDSALYALAGNAITVPLVHSIASHIVHSLDMIQRDVYSHKMAEGELSKHEILDLYSHFKNYYILRESIYSGRLKKHRLPNFPEDVSENIIRMHIGNNCTWNTAVGDLKTIHDNKKIEVKCVNSKGPMSFGPNCKWDKLFILEWIDLKLDTFNIYECPHPNTHECIQSLPVSKTETFAKQSNDGKRPRINLPSFKKHLGDLLTVVFNGTIYDLLQK